MTVRAASKRWGISRNSRPSQATVSVGQRPDAEINVSHDTVWRFLRSEGKTFHKTLVASEQDRPNVFRMRWKPHQRRLDPDRLVFINDDLGQDQHDAHLRLAPAGIMPPR